MIVDNADFQPERVWSVPRRTALGCASATPRLLVGARLHAASAAFTPRRPPAVAARVMRLSGGEFAKPEIRAGSCSMAGRGSYGDLFVGIVRCP